MHFCIGEAVFINPHKSLNTSAAIIIFHHSLDFSRDNTFLTKTWYRNYYFFCLFNGKTVSFVQCLSQCTFQSFRYFAAHTFFDFHKTTFAHTKQKNYFCGMEKLRRSHWVKLFFIMCLLVQGLLLFPHHHHSGTTAACFNTWHCTGQHHHNLSNIPFHSENDGCCDHNHRNAQIPCSHQSSLTVPSRPDLLPVPDQIILHTTDAVLHILVSCRECQQQYDECRVTLLIQECPEKPDTYLKYSIKALPSRAGTHIA